MPEAWDAFLEIFGEKCDLVPHVMVLKAFWHFDRGHDEEAGKVLDAAIAALNQVEPAASPGPVCSKPEKALSTVIVRLHSGQVFEEVFIKDLKTLNGFVRFTNADNVKVYFLREHIARIEEG